MINMEIFDNDNITDKSIGKCKHAFYELMINVSGFHEMIGLKYCKKCKKIFKEGIVEVKY